MRVIIKIYRRCVLNGAAIHGQYGVKGHYDRRATVGLHNLAASISTAVLNGQAGMRLESRQKFVFCCRFRRRQPEHGISCIKHIVIARAFAEGLAVQVQRDVALLQLYAGVVFMADGHIRQQLHRGAVGLLCRRKRRVNVGVRRGAAVDGDLRHRVFHGAVPAVLSGNAIFRRLFQYGGRFRSRSFLLLLLLLLLHGGADLRRVRFLRRSFLLLLLLHDGAALRRVLRRPRGRGE